MIEIEGCWSGLGMASEASFFIIIIIIIFIYEWISINYQNVFQQIS